MAINGGLSGLASPSEFTAATGAGTGAVMTTVTAAPIAQVLPYLKVLYSSLASLFSFSISLMRPLLRLSPLPIILYLIAPLVVFIDIVVTLFIRTPYRTVTYLLEDLFPIYVLCGVACITGVVVGLAARGISSVIVNALSVDEDMGHDHDTHTIKAGAKEDSKGKARRVEKVKFES